jgi:hypothetical protein
MLLIPTGRADETCILCIVLGPPSYDNATVSVHQSTVNDAHVSLHVCFFVKRPFEMHTGQTTVTGGVICQLKSGFLPWTSFKCKVRSVFTDENTEFDSKQPYRARL